MDGALVVQTISTCIDVKSLSVWQEIHLFQPGFDSLPLDSVLPFLIQMEIELIFKNWICAPSLSLTTPLGAITTAESCAVKKGEIERTKSIMYHNGCPNWKTVLASWTV